MALGKLSQWIPSMSHLDPRPSEKYAVGAKYCVVSVTKHPTFASMIKSGQSIANSRMVGLIQSFAAPQAIPLFALFELGAKYPYTVPGKFRGNIALSSMVFDAGANLLGGIYEEVFSKGTGPGGRIELTNAGKQILNTPALYDQDDPRGPGPIPYGMEDVGVNLPVGDSNEYKDYGAIRMSLDDNRLTTPFGLIFTIFQSQKRIVSNYNPSIEGDRTGFNPEDIDSNHFRIMNCLFFEMARVQNYDIQTAAEQEVIFESANIFYHGLVNVKTTVMAGEPLTGSEGDRTGYQPGQ